MPLLRRPNTGPYDHERRRGWPAALGALTALLAAGLIGWAIGNAGGSGSTTRTVTRTVSAVAVPATVQVHTPAGAVAAAQANLAAAERSCLPGERCQSPAAYSLGPDGGGLWSLAYRIKGYSSTYAVVEAWQLGIAAGGPSPSRLSWGLADIPLGWNGSEWRPVGQVSQLAVGPTPPPDGTSGPAAQSFARGISTFWRFPGAP
jgi:hypothetical protein